jgi:lysophospholipase L1-like esterase
MAAMAVGLGLWGLVLGETEHTGTYVALGSSFASGPGIASRAEGSPPMCFQSSGNYPHLVAQRLGIELVDRSCGGATTAHVLNREQNGLAPQVQSVTAQTRLVTITIGGNDVGYLLNLAAWSCERRPEVLPEAFRALGCKPQTDSEVDAEFGELGEHLREIATEVHRRAPDALILFVDYTTILPSKGSCPDRLPMSDAHVERGRRVAARLAQVTAQAARASGATLVRASALTSGHDLCSPDPWVAGWVFPHSLDEWAPGAYHPSGAAMQAIATEVARVAARELARPKR